ncbi:MAG: TIR domain-containing protein [Crocinitomix sp.]|nr:TIR domain-containing protein [Crocinitomix sp.]
MKVFLGGTCNNSLWREDLIPKLTIDYFNPVVDEWSDEAYNAEVTAKLDCNYFLYCISPKYTGYFSFAEVVNESYHYSNQTIFCFLTEDGDQKFTEAQIESLEELGEKVVENGGLWLENLAEVAAFLNSSQETRVQLNRYDFFISYGRKHSSSLASKLNNSFIKDGKTVWMDKLCIPTGVDFQKSIKEGIAKSDNFIYIISPHSVQSEYCTRELEVALKYGKRIIPILHIMEPGLDELMHPEIQKLNWINFDAERKFQHGQNQLLILTSADEIHLENNTKWLQKALEWDSNDRHKDFLLSQTETKLAEEWYNNALEKAKKPPPSPINGIFIKESAKIVLYAKNRRRRIGVLITGLIVMSLAFVIAIYSYSQAETAKKAAVESAIEAITQKERADSLAYDAQKQRKIAEQQSNHARVSQDRAQYEASIMIATIDSLISVIEALEK